MINFIFGVHNHQPIGQSPQILEAAYQKAYKPFLEALTQYPNLKVNFHISGSLLEWLVNIHPEYIETLKRLIRENRVEVLTSGFYEPILTLIPKADSIAQIRLYSQYLKKVFCLKSLPAGLWLTERIWEHNLIRILTAVGIKWTLLDDTNFHQYQEKGIEFGFDGERVLQFPGYFLTEDEGDVLLLFPISKRLRYYIPFYEVSKTFRFFEALNRIAGSPLLTLFDDGEKFGLWPGTYEHCYEKGWLPQFFSSLAQSDFIKTVLISEYLKPNPLPLERVYIDYGSYDEMGEWVLSPKVYQEFRALKTTSHLIKGGYFRNFLTKYPEANLIHKRMLFISKKIKLLHFDQKKQKVKEAQKELFKGQTNDIYWHGIFGGLYLPHLREGVYSHLVSADRILSKNQGLSYFDFDACGSKEFILDNDDLFIVVSPKLGGSILILDLKKYGINLFNILSRREESYHIKIKNEISKIKDTFEEEVKSIHLTDRKLTNGKPLIYDPYPRFALLDHFLSLETSPADFENNRFKEIYNFTLTERSLTKSPMKRGLIRLTLPVEKPHFSKILSWDKPGLKISYQFAKFSNENPFRFGVEFGFGPLINDASGIKEQVSEFKIERRVKDKKIDIFLSSKNMFDVWYFPLETVTSSEKGFEKIYQGTVVLISWIVNNPFAHQKLDFDLNWEF